MLIKLKYFQANSLEDIHLKLENNFLRCGQGKAKVESLLILAAVFGNRISRSFWGKNKERMKRFLILCYRYLGIS